MATAAASVISDRTSARRRLVHRGSASDREASAGWISSGSTSARDVITPSVLLLSPWYSSSTGPKPHMAENPAK